jgi:hypothetical protein
VELFKQEYGPDFEITIDFEMKKRTNDIMERHARRYGRTLEQDNLEAMNQGFHFAYTPHGYLYGQPQYVSCKRPRALEWLCGDDRSDEQQQQDDLIARSKAEAEEINFQGETLINPSDKLIHSDNSRHSFAQKRKHQTNKSTQTFLYSYLNPVY